jgi:Ca-activated chloride channel family protein
MMEPGAAQQVWSAAAEPRALRPWYRRKGLVAAVAAVAVVALIVAVGVTIHGLTGNGSGTVAKPTGDAATPAIVAVPTVLILDASGSMNETDAPGPRIDAAKAAAQGLVDALPDDATLALETYGTSTGSSDAEHDAGCADVKTLIPLAKLDRNLVRGGIAGLNASGYTPISLALRNAVGQLPADDSAQAVVLVSDGEDTCGEPPCDTAAQAKRTHPNLTISTVGFKTDGPASDQLSCIANATGGLFVQAGNASQLAARLLATQNIGAAASALSSDGLDDIRLGQSVTDIRNAHNDFPDASSTGGVVVVWRDCDFTFTDGTLDSIAPHDGGHTIDGVRPGTVLSRATELYGGPLAVVDNGDGSHSVLYTADAATSNTYRILVEDFSDSGGTVSGKVKTISICRCKPQPVNLPDAPPQVAGCPTTPLAHNDIQHPKLGPMRIFLLWDGTGTGGPVGSYAGCIVGVTANGKVTASIPVNNADRSSFAFANPAQDATGNTFVTYNPGRYDGVDVLVPNDGGFEDIGFKEPDYPYVGGRLGFYDADVDGPGADGKYTIKQSRNDCEPDCAGGTVTTKTLHWDGHDYVE